MDDLQTKSPPAPRTEVLNRRPQMDGLRALCFLAVYFYHADRDHHWAGSGYAGVYVFFALSGFLIAGILAQAKRTPATLADFYARRLLRICPIYFAYLAVVATLGGKGSAGLTWYWLYLGNVRIALDRAWATRPISHFWTLAVEFQFYLFFPILLYLLPRRAWAATILGLVILSKAARVYYLQTIDNHWALLLTSVAAEYLLWGAFFALVPAPRTERGCVVTALSGLLMLGLWTGWTQQGGGPHGYSESPLFTYLSGTVDGLGCALLVRGLWWSTGPLARWLTREPLVYLGTISYGLYVYHAEAIFVVWRLQHLRYLPRWTNWFVPLGLSIAVAAASWHGFEKPINGLKRFLPIRRRGG